RSDAAELLKRHFSGNDVPPFELRLPDDRVTMAGRPGPPEFRVHLRTDRGVQALKTLDEATIGLAYVNEEIDIEGDFLAVLDLRTKLSDRHPVSWLLRFAVRLLVGQVRSNKHWVPKHYDHGNDLYFAFLDKRHRLYSQALYTHEDETIEQ